MIYWIGAAIFALSSLLFAYLETKKQTIKQIFRSHMFVSFITTISYIIMAIMLATSTAENGDLIFWSRWLFYMASCSILTVDIAHFFKKPTTKKIEIAILTTLTMFCGFLASIIVNTDRWWFFALSSVAYIAMLLTLFKQSKKSETLNKSIMWYVGITWSIFPIVWILAPTGFGIITTFNESIAYLALDLITKIAFGLYITSQKNLE
jgi:sensory rhodopsin